MSVVQPEPFPLDRLRRGFDRRAARAVDARFLHDEIAHRMAEKLAVIRTAPALIADVGCGTSASHAQLRTRFAGARWLGVELSAAMIAAAAPRRSWLARLAQALGREPAPQWLQADMAALPLAAGTVNLLWSNLALHWSATPDAVIGEWHRVLAPDGVLMFSALGPDTGKQLRAALAAAGGPVQMPAFVDMHDYGDMMTAHRYATPVVDMEMLDVCYETPAALLRDVRALGLYPGTAFAGLRTRRWRDRLYAALDAQRNADGLIPLTFELVYGHGWKPPQALAAAAARDGTAVVGIDQIGGRRAQRQGEHR